MRLASFLLFALVASMILTNLPLQGFADPQLDSLLRIANQARDNIKIRLSQTSALPDEILKLYNQGSLETDALAQSVSQGDISGSRQHFLSAMRLFKEANDKLSSSIPAEGGESLPAQEVSRLNNAIGRMAKTAERLKVIATKNNVEIDFAKFDKLIQTARQSLETGNADEVIKTLKIANQFLLDAHRTISAAAKQRVSDRAKDFASKQIERLDKLITQAKDLGVSENITDTLAAAKRKLKETSDAGQIATEVKGINAIKEKLEAIRSSKGTINETSTAVQSSGNETKSVERVTPTINETSNVPAPLVNETKNIEKRGSDNQRISTPSDARLERIKQKIQNLEEEISHLSEKASGNDVAMQLLRQASSLIDDAKNQLEKSVEKATRTLNQVEKIIYMVQRMV